MSLRLAALVVFACFGLTPAPITTNDRQLTRDEEYRLRVAKNKKIKENRDRMERTAVEQFHKMWSEQGPELGASMERLMWEDKVRARTGKDPELTIENMSPEQRVSDAAETCPDGPQNRRPRRDSQQ